MESVLGAEQVAEALAMVTVGMGSASIGAESVVRELLVSESKVESSNE